MVMVIILFSTFSKAQMHFTIQLRGEIGHQLVKAPMTAAISPLSINIQQLINIKVHVAPNVFITLNKFTCYLKLYCKEIFRFG